MISKNIDFEVSGGKSCRPSISGEFTGKHENLRIWAISPAKVKTFNSDRSDRKN